MQSLSQLQAATALQPSSSLSKLHAPISTRVLVKVLVERFLTDFGWFVVVDTMSESWEEARELPHAIIPSTAIISLKKRAIQVSIKIFAIYSPEKHTAEWKWANRWFTILTSTGSLQLLNLSNANPVRSWLKTYNIKKACNRAWARACIHSFVHSSYCACVSVCLYTRFD